jgi:cytochrome c oxidase subunit 4
MKDSGDMREILRGPLLAWAALCLLLAITVAAAYVPLGAGNLLVSLTIAAAKAAVIAIAFMELARANSLQRLAAFAGLFWLLFLFVLMFADYLTR